MAWLKLSEINSMVSGTLQGHDALCTGISIDTRKILPEQLFIALRGEHYDGHQFVEQSIAAGACAVMVEKVSPLNFPQIIVQNTLQALQELARQWRASLSPTVVAVTGSNGKTTSKEILCSILRLWCKFKATEKNLNNHIGVPLSLLKLEDKDQVAVLEMGANHQKEIAFLTQMIQPDIAWITNAGPAHLEGFGSLEGVAQGKGELFENLKSDGIAIVNADDTYASYWESLLPTQKIIRFGLHKKAHVSGQYSVQECHINIDNETHTLNMPLRGEHNLSNALGASAVAHALGVPSKTIVQGIEAMEPVAGRLVPVAVTKDMCLLDDTYNANPASLQSALNTLSEYPGQKWLILGTMAELGEQAPEWHAQAADMARQCKVNRLFAMGDFAKYAVKSFGQKGQCFDTLEELTQCLSAELKHEQAVTLLVKGSRSAGMEQVVHNIMAMEDWRA